MVERRQADRRLEPRPRRRSRATSDGERVARRGGGGLVTALRSLVAHHDVTWIASAMTRRGSRGRRRNRGRGDRGAGARRLAVPAAARRPRSGGLRLVLQRRRQPDAVVPAALPLGSRDCPEHRPRALSRLGRWVFRRSTRLSRRPRSLSSRRSRRPPCFFHDYHLYLAPRYVREATPAGPGALRPHSLARAGTWAALSSVIRHALHEGLLAYDVLGFHADRWRESFLRSSRDLLANASFAPALRSVRVSC